MSSCCSTFRDTVIHLHVDCLLRLLPFHPSRLRSGLHRITAPPSSVEMATLGHSSDELRHFCLALVRHPKCPPAHLWVVGRRVKGGDSTLLTWLLHHTGLEVMHALVQHNQGLVLNACNMMGILLYMTDGHTTYTEEFCKEIIRNGQQCMTDVNEPDFVGETILATLLADYDCPAFMLATWLEDGRVAVRERNCPGTLTPLDFCIKHELRRQPHLRYLPTLLAHANYIFQSGDHRYLLHHPPPITMCIIHHLGLRHIFR